ncbi:MAG TPA: hypothetical protein VGQ20_10005 [Acidimicrobiales bacterium]|jgi:hypothetical protein|nr:hypothetical protein [Acidimicrobiales bacterium]
MPSYDPQRNRPRATLGDDAPSAVDALLAATASSPGHGDATAAPIRDTGDAHRHGPACDHDHAHGPGLAARVGAIVMAVVTLLLLRRWRRSHRQRRAGHRS